MSSTHHGIQLHVVFSTKNRAKLIESSWEDELGIFSVSESQSAIVKQYIQNQREHHARRSFEVEYLIMLRKHGIEFDERYVFDEETVD